MILSAQEQGMLKGFKVSDDSEEFPITQYVDDSLIKMEAKSEAIDNLRTILPWFEEVVGLKMNLSKQKCTR